MIYIILYNYNMICDEKNLEVNHIKTLPKAIELCKHLRLVCALNPSRAPGAPVWSPLQAFTY